MGMTAHVVFTAFDPIAPATTSATMVAQVIRDSIGFQGLLMSDDLSMGALSGTLGERMRAALAAGCDIVLHCNGDMAEMQAVAAEASRARRQCGSPCRGGARGAQAARRYRPGRGAQGLRNAAGRGRAGRRTDGVMTPEEIEFEAAVTAERATDEPALVVDVEGFEGPLDLLLMLARQQKVDLAKISILALGRPVPRGSSRRRDDCGSSSPPTTW